MKKKPTAAAKGRPKKEFGHKSAQIVIHVEPKNKERYRSAARSAEMDFSDWVRMILEEATRRELDSTVEQPKGG